MNLKPTKFKRFTFFLFIDILISIFSVCIAFVLRFSGDIPNEFYKGLLLSIFCITLIKICFIWFFKIYIAILRGTPLMLQLFVVYFLPYYAFGISLKNMGENWLFISVIVGFTLNYAAYFAEIYRSGLNSIPEGQYDAAKVLGLNKRNTFFLIILPQLFKRILPAITNEIITLVKDTSLAFAIGQMEMFTKAERLASAEVSLLPYAAAAIIYFLLNLLVAWIMSLLEKRMNKYTIK